MEDRRAGERIYKDVAFYYKVYKKIDLAGDVSQIKNMSTGGALIVTAQQLSSDMVIELIIREPGSKKKLALFGRVLDCVKKKDALAFEARVTFLYLDSKAESALRETLRKLSLCNL